LGRSGKEARPGSPLSSKAGRIFLGHSNKPAGVSASFNFPDCSMMGSALLLQRQGALSAPGQETWLYKSSRFPFLVVAGEVVGGDLFKVSG